MLDKLPHFAYLAKHGGVEERGRREKSVEDASGRMEEGQSRARDLQYRLAVPCQILWYRWSAERS